MKRVTETGVRTTGAEIMQVLPDGSGGWELSYLDGVVLAHSANPRWLSNWAFEHGAVECRHWYDLKLAEGL